MLVDKNTNNHFVWFTVMMQAHGPMGGEAVMMRQAIAQVDDQVHVLTEHLAQLQEDHRNHVEQANRNEEERAIQEASAERARRRAREESAAEHVLTKQNAQFQEDTRNVTNCVDEEAEERAMPVAQSALSYNTHTHTRICCAPHTHLSCHTRTQTLCVPNSWTLLFF